MVRSGSGAVHRCGLFQRFVPLESGCAHEGAHVRCPLFNRKYQEEYLISIIYIIHYF